MYFCETVLDEISVLAFICGHSCCAHYDLYFFISYRAQQEVLEYENMCGSIENYHMERNRVEHFIANDLSVGISKMYKKPMADLDHQAPSIYNILLGGHIL